VTDLSERQQQLLKAIIEEYIDTAEPVGSEAIDRKYKLGVSPATIRNEMASLTELGFLKQPHTSAGRAPTSTGLKYYIQNLMQEKELSVRDEVAVKEKLWDERFHFHRLLRDMTRSMAEMTGGLAVATTHEGELYHSGSSSLLDMPEFYDIDVAKTVLSMMDNADTLVNLFNRAVGEDPIKILLGEDLGLQFLEPVGMVFTHYDAGQNHYGSIGIVGPSRMPYFRVVPTVRYYRNLLGEMSQGW
jgi:heat-inducible transcriptional repressor